ncbi:hypothetical protein V6N11_041871 [Hibiscus sabdariffa]|uniref:Uncharacterized protein n=2 Tax=Hibiscus sabdariffa TaxID=183260 RepID=A0ABR2ACX1_9ROSI
MGYPFEISRFTASPLVYLAAEEDMSHLFRDCVEARSIWPLVIKPEKVHEFHSLELRSWLLVNLINQQQFSIHKEDWDIVFGTIL